MRASVGTTSEEARELARQRLRLGEQVLLVTPGTGEGDASPERTVSDILDGSDIETIPVTVERPPEGMRGRIAVRLGD